MTVVVPPTFCYRNTSLESTGTRVIGWSRSFALLSVLTSGYAFENRTVDHPCDGFVVRGSTVYVHVQRNVPLICKAARMRGRQPPASYLEPHALDADMLRRLTKAAHATLPGCV